jgi:YesN/AraC family two-component response regulator
MSDIKKLKSISKGFNLLYVEDNKALRENASNFLSKIFDKVGAAQNGQEGFEKFKQDKYHIVITDIKMPIMDGLELCKNIKKISPNTKIIIMSAFDDTQYLLDSIEVGVYRYLKKPVSSTNLAEVLYSCVDSIIKENNELLFYTNIKNIFNYQSSMVIMLDKENPIFANQTFLQYFDINSIEEFIQKYNDLGTILLEHDSFLYNKVDKTWFEEISNNPQKLYNIKIKDKNHNFKHFILKYQTVPDKDNLGILSFDDITELNLLKLFDERTSKNDEDMKSSKELFDFLEVIKRNSAKITLHNYYKGLCITNDALITDIGKDNVTIKTKYLQQKAIQTEGKTILLSDALPFAIECANLLSMNFEMQNIVLNKLRFIKNSPTRRSTVRIVPDDKHTVSLFIGENKLHTEIKIDDISLDAVRLSTELLPPHLEENQEVTLDIVLQLDNKPLIINTKATILRKMELKYSFSLVCIFKEFNKNGLTKYITKRQMAIIREFKGLQNG